MGARANFVLIDGDGPRLHYSHWAADTIASVLIAGPDPACRFIDAQRLCDPATDWLDDVWCEGGAVVDLTKRELVYFGDQLLWEVPEKLVFSLLLARTWPGWRLRWAYDGIGDLAAAAGVDRSLVRKLNPERRWLPDTVTEDLEDAHLLTVTAGGVTTAYPLDSSLPHFAWLGPVLLERLPTGGTTRLVLDGAPSAGLHVDVDAHRIGVWIGFTAPGLLPALIDLWPGWHIDFWFDRYTEQLARCGDAVEVPFRHPAETLDEVVDHLAKRLGRNPVESMLSLVDTMETESDQQIRLNPFFTAHQPVDPTATEWSVVLQTAAALRAELAVL
ncbi:hypothetical protein [Nocardia sp. NPDC004722]